MKGSKEPTTIPLVSVCIITYNQVEFMHETLQSALQQDYANIEIIVADDGSTDGTAEIIIDYARKFPGKIVSLIGGPNLGVTGNSNRGLRACKGQYVAFMGGDDTLLPCKITKQVAWLESDKDRVLCYHDVDVYDSETGKTIYLWSQKYRLRMGNAREVVKNGNFFAAMSVMVRYPHELNIVFNENIKVASDFFMWIEILERQSGSFGYVEGVYSRYRRHLNNVSSTGGSLYLHDSLATLDAIETLAPNKYDWECNQKRSETYLIEAHRRIWNKDYWIVFSLLLRSFCACHGFWMAPARILLRKIKAVRYGGFKVRVQRGRVD